MCWKIIYSERFELLCDEDHVTECVRTQRLHTEFSCLTKIPNCPFSRSSLEGPLSTVLGTRGFLSLSTPLMKGSQVSLKPLKPCRINLHPLFHGSPSWASLLRWKEESLNHHHQSPPSPPHKHTVSTEMDARD